jgi:hypothetical protein
MNLKIGINFMFYMLCSLFSLRYPFYRYYKIIPINLIDVEMIFINLNVDSRINTLGQQKFGLPPIDPLRINSLYIDQGQGSVIVKLNFTNLDIIGMSKSVIESVR